MASDVKAGGAFIQLYIKNSVERDLKGIEKRMQSFLGRVRGLSVGGLGAGVGLSFGLGISLQQVGEFDKAIRTAAAAAGLGEKGVGALRERISQLSTESGLAAESLAGIAIELARGGVGEGSADRLLAATQAAALLQKATGTQAETVGRTLVALSSQFNIAEKDLISLSDKLTVSANISAQSVDDILEALQYAGPVAKQLGLSIDEVLSYTAVLANLGIKGSEAGTALRRLLLITSTDAASLSSIFDVPFNEGERLIDQLQRMGSATANLSNEARAAKFKEAFDFLGITGSLALSGTDSLEAFNEALEKIANSAGEAQKQADLIGGGLGGSIDKLTAKLKALQDTFVTALDSSPFVQLAGEGIGKLTELIGNNPELATGLVGIAGGLTALGVAVGGISFVGLEGLGGIIAGLTNIVGPQVLGVGALEVAYRGWTGAAGEQRSLLGDLSSLLYDYTDSLLANARAEAQAGIEAEKARKVAEARAASIRAENAATLAAAKQQAEQARLIGQKLEGRISFGIAPESLDELKEARATVEGIAKSRAAIGQIEARNTELLREQQELQERIAKDQEARKNPILGGISPDALADEARQAIEGRLLQIEAELLINPQRIEQQADSIARLIKELEQIPSLTDEISQGLLGAVSGTVDSVVKKAVEAQIAAVESGNDAAARQLADLVEQAKALSKEAEARAQVGDSEGLKKAAAEAAKITQEAERLSFLASSPDALENITANVVALDSALQVAALASRDLSQEDRERIQKDIEELRQLRAESEAAFNKGDLEKAAELAKKGRERAAELQEDALKDQREFAKERFEREQRDQEDLAESFRRARDASLSAVSGFNADNLRGQIVQFDIEGLLEALSEQTEVLRKIEAKRALFV
jgi:TP901 family phage tail tape measure protein